MERDSLLLQQPSFLLFPSFPLSKLYTHDLASITKKRAFIVSRKENFNVGENSYSLLDKFSSIKSTNHRVIRELVRINLVG